MSGLFGLLNSGRTGLNAQSYALQVTGQNLANASTEGYTRRDVRMSPLGPPPPGGGGVRALGSRRIRDEFVEQRLLGATAARAEAESRRDNLAILDTVLADVDGSLGRSLDDFEDALSQLTGEPDEDAVRQGVLTSAERVARSFRDAAAQLNRAQSELDRRIELQVDDLNATLARIAELGTAIQRAEATGPEASDLRDERDRLITEVAEVVPVTVVEDEQGVNLLLDGGPSLVSSAGEAATLQAGVNGATGRMEVRRVTAGAPEDVTGLIDGGSLGGAVAARDGGIQRALDGLDQLAFDFATAYNAVHSAGVGLDGVGARNLFTPPAGVANAAASFAVSADVAGQPSNIAAATDPTVVSGDNRNALELYGVSQQLVANAGSQTLQESLGSIIADAGFAMQGAELDLTVTSGAEVQLENIRASISGVSTDEETLNLTKFQRGYQASLRVVQVADQMLQELIALAT